MVSGARTAVALGYGMTNRRAALLLLISVAVGSIGAAAGLSSGKSLALAIGTMLVTFVAMHIRRNP